jgi:hypothetical protein
MNVASDKPMVASGRLEGRNSPKLPAVVVALDAMNTFWCQTERLLRRIRTGRTRAKTVRVARMKRSGPRDGVPGFRR